MAGENTDPARAFDDLRAEVSVLRRAVEGLPEAWRENRPPDYSPDLGRMVNALGAVGERLKAVEETPMLKSEPSSYRYAVEQAGIAASQRMQGVFDSAIREVQVERRQLAGIVGEARDRYRQRWWVLGASGLAFLCGFAVAAPLFRVIPWDANLGVASFIVGGSDRWDSGRTMMSAARPRAWNNIIWEENLVRNNSDKIIGCEDEANKSKVTEECTIKVKPD